ncbi:MAG: hypothetical protein ACFFD4_24970 [Candidatus Odinarchaeota archaeon]
MSDLLDEKTKKMLLDKYNTIGEYLGNGKVKIWKEALHKITITSLDDHEEEGEAGEREHQ